MDKRQQIDKLTNEKRKPSHGVVAVLVEQEQFLVIRRSAKVRAPNLICFAGGSIEPGETPEQAIVREMMEELNLDVKPLQHVWQSRTAWGTLLEWVVVERAPNCSPKANPDEVADWMWITPEGLLKHPDLLPSVPSFFHAWAHGHLELPESAGRPNAQWCELQW